MHLRKGYFPLTFEPGVSIWAFGFRESSFVPPETASGPPGDLTAGEVSALFDALSLPAASGGAEQPMIKPITTKDAKAKTLFNLGPTDTWSCPSVCM